MRVLVDTTFASRGPSGTGVYLEQLLPALRAEGVEVVEAARPGRYRRAGGRAPAAVRSAAHLAADLRWSAVELPRRAAAAGADVLHHPLPAPSRRGPVPQAVTVHDLAFVHHPERFAPAFQRYAAVAHRAAARRAAVVVAVSEATADDVHHLWRVPRERIVVAPHGPGQVGAESVTRAAQPEHFLHVGDAEPRKDLPVLLAAYARYRATAPAPLALVVAGTGEDPRAPGVRHVQRPDAAAMLALHAGAAALVHPSRHEGFGLTPLEAMAAGTPVVAVASPGVLEVCGDAALYVDAGDAAGLADRLAALALDAGLRRDLAERGRRRAARYSWQRSAQAHVAAYASAISPRRT